MKSPRSTRGFTLVELQVALLIIALMSVLMVGALRLASRTWSAVTERQDTAEHRYLITQLLRRHLANARFFRISTDAGLSGMSFFGDRHQVHFVAPFPSFHNDGELYWWTLMQRWNDQQQRTELVMGYFLFDATQPVTLEPDGSLFVEDIEPSVLVIADDITDLELRYFIRDKDGLEAWVDEWELGAETPLVIGLSVRESVAGDGGDSGNNSDSRDIHSDDLESILLPEILVSPRFSSQELFSTDSGAP